MRVRDTFLAALAGTLLVAAPAAAQTGYSAVINGAAQVPANPSAGVGTAALILSADGTTLSFSIQFSGLTGNFSASHIHAPANPTQNAGVVLNWGVAPFLSVNPDQHGGTIIGSLPVNATLVSNLNAGLCYVNIHSSTSPGGEIRGQLMPDQSVPTGKTSWGRIKGLYR